MEVMYILVCLTADERIKGKYRGVLGIFVKNDEIRPSSSCQIIIILE